MWRKARHPKEVVQILARWSIKLDTLRYLDVNIKLYILMSLILPDMLILFFSQERSEHAAVVVKTDTIILLGGYESQKTGENVKSKLTILAISYYISQTWSLSLSNEFLQSF